MGSEGPEKSKNIPRFGYFRNPTTADIKREIENRRGGLEEQDNWEEQLVSSYFPKLAAFQKALNFEWGTVYYPFCADDTSPSKAFPRSRVVYADTDAPTMRKLQEEGYEAYEKDAEKFNPGPVDVLVLLRSTAPTDVPISHVKEGGYVICHDWKGDASKLHKSPDFEFVALVHPGEGGEYVYDISDLEDCWKEMNDDEELRAHSRTGLSHFKVNPYFWDVVSTVRWITGKRENYVEEYKQILKKIREGTLEDAELIEDGFPWMDIEYKGRHHTLFTNMPHKKGIIDDFYVFRKKVHE